MVSVTILLLVAATILAAIAARSKNQETPFAFLSAFAPALFIASFAGLRHNGDSLPFYAAFCLSLVLAPIGTAWGAALIIMRRKQGPLGKLIFLTALSALPLFYAAAKSSINLVNGPAIKEGRIDGPAPAWASALLKPPDLLETPPQKR